MEDEHTNVAMTAPVVEQLILVLMLLFLIIYFGENLEIVDQRQTGQSRRLYFWVQPLSNILKSCE